MGNLPSQTYQDIKKEKIDFDSLRSKLKVKHLEEKEKFSKKFPKAASFLDESKIDLGKIREQSAKILGASFITGAMLLSPPATEKYLPPPDEIIEKAKISEDKKLSIDIKDVFTNSINSVIPKDPRPLNRNEEKYLEQIFKNLLKVPAKATLEGEHLNTTYGYIGAEQHLIRYPGDSLDKHSDDSKILKSGIAPGLGAWGYFANSNNQMTPQLVETEKWYAVVQTLYLPDWNTNTRYLKNWYKYRKVLIVNVDNGQAVIAAVSDSGPAAWTGKQFGGSPEVMNYLGGERYKKGKVIVFFVDDPDNKLPLGPVEY